MRARVGLRPKSPQHEAGMRIDPPPSLPCAIGTIPLATAADKTYQFMALAVISEPGDIAFTVTHLGNLAAYT